jgi:hypothetical protein
MTGLGIRPEVLNDDIAGLVVVTASGMQTRNLS